MPVSKIEKQALGYHAASRRLSSLRRSRRFSVGFLHFLCSSRERLCTLGQIVQLKSLSARGSAHFAQRLNSGSTFEEAENECHCREASHALSTWCREDCIVRRELLILLPKTGELFAKSCGRPQAQTPRTMMLVLWLDIQTMRQSAEVTCFYCRASSLHA